MANLKLASHRGVEALEKFTVGRIGRDERARVAWVSTAGWKEHRIAPMELRCRGPPTLADLAGGCPPALAKRESMRTLRRFVGGVRLVKTESTVCSSAEATLLCPSTWPCGGSLGRGCLQWGIFRSLELDNPDRAQAGKALTNLCFGRHQHCLQGCSWPTTARFF